MNGLRIFKYDAAEVRTVIKDSELWWVLKDVCDVLGLTTPARVAERLDEDEVSLTHITDSRVLRRNLGETKKRWGKSQIKMI